ncbi:MAG: thioredoxin family protein [Sphingopyxis sp.]|nr:thioredoxin family protein [Sphingopyxis sp.]
MTSIEQISEEAFSDRVLRSSMPTLVDFGSKSCGVCLANAPAVQNVADEYEGELSVVKVDVEASPGLANTYAVRSLPTLLMFKGGEVVDRMMGHLTRSSLARFVEKHLESGE